MFPIDLFLEDPRFPGVILTKQPRHFTVTFDRMNIDLVEDGLFVKIPANSFMLGESIDVIIATSFSGPFMLPDGVQAVSPVYFVKLSREVKIGKDIEVIIQHNASVKQGLVFLKSTSTYSVNSPSYTFQIMDTCVEALQDKPNWGLVKMRRFCGFLVGARVDSQHGNCKISY